MKKHMEKLEQKNAPFELIRKMKEILQKEHIKANLYVIPFLDWKNTSIQIKGNTTILIGLKGFSNNNEVLNAFLHEIGHYYQPSYAFGMSAEKEAWINAKELAKKHNIKFNAYLMRKCLWYARFNYKLLKASQIHGIVNSNTINIDYYKVLKWLARANNNSLRHARTYEEILFTSVSFKKKIKFTKKLKNGKKVLIYPALTYAKAQNQKLFCKRNKAQELVRAYRFILKDEKIIAQEIYQDINGNLNIRNIKPNQVKYSKSNQWKSSYPKPKSKTHAPEKIPYYSTFNTLSQVNFKTHTQKRKLTKLTKKEKYVKKFHKYLNRIGNSQ